MSCHVVLRQRVHVHHVLKGCYMLRQAYFEWIDPRSKWERMCTSVKGFLADMLEMLGPVMFGFFLMVASLPVVVLVGAPIAAHVEARAAEAAAAQPAAPIPSSSQKAKLHSKDGKQPPVSVPTAVALPPPEAPAGQHIQESAPQQLAAERTASPAAITDDLQLNGCSAASTAPSSTKPSGCQAGGEGLALQPRKPDLAGGVCACRLNALSLHASVSLGHCPQLQLRHCLQRITGLLPDGRS
jgi:hypothetical protein